MVVPSDVCFSGCFWLQKLNLSRYPGVMREPDVASARAASWAILSCSASCTAAAAAASFSRRLWRIAVVSESDPVSFTKNLIAYIAWILVVSLCFFCCCSNAGWKVCIAIWWCGKSAGQISQETFLPVKTPRPTAMITAIAGPPALMLIWRSVYITTTTAGDFAAL